LLPSLLELSNVGILLYRFGDLVNDGECTTAQKLADQGSITCASLPCPGGCDICEMCLDRVLDCPVPSAEPSVAPTSFTDSPSVPFDLYNCESYSDRW